MVDFSHLPTRCKFIALMPQWDFLDFLAEHGRRYPDFHLLMQAEATDLIEEGGRVTGVRATTPDGELEIRAALVVGCDGRHSTVRDKAGLQVEDVGAPMDVLWFRLSRHDQRHRGDRRPLRGRASMLRHAQPRRLLAVRLRHPEGRHRGGEARGAARRSATASSSMRAVSAQTASAS